MLDLRPQHEIELKGGQNEEQFHLYHREGELEAYLRQELLPVIEALGVKTVSNEAILDRVRPEKAIDHIREPT